MYINILALAPGRCVQRRTGRSNIMGLQRHEKIRAGTSSANWNDNSKTHCMSKMEEELTQLRAENTALKTLLSAHKIELRLEEARSMGQSLHAVFTGVLRPDQQEALNAVSPHHFGMLVAPTAFGKTVTAAAVIAQRKVSTLVLVHRTDAAMARTAGALHGAEWRKNCSRQSQVCKY